MDEANHSVSAELGWLRPQYLQPCIIVDVFLPKNIVNLSRLTKLLQETLDFDFTRKYLNSNAKKLFIEYQAAPDSEPTEEMEYHPQVRRDEPRTFPSVDRMTEFKSRLRRMEKRIEGYSIFEVDGAFELLNHKSTVLHRGRSARHVVPKRSQTLRHFRDRSARFVNIMFPRGRGSAIGGRLQVYPPKPDDATQRIVEIAGTSHTQRHHFTRDGSGFNSRRCLTVVEERNLMIRFITKPVSTFRSEDPFGHWAGVFPGAVQDVLWDTLMVVGCAFARRLGREGGVEDEIWLTYDVGQLWIWKNGESMLRESKA